MSQDNKLSVNDYTNMLPEDRLCITHEELIDSALPDWIIKEIVLSQTEWALQEGYLKDTKEGEALSTYRKIKQERQWRFFNGTVGGGGKE